MLGSSRHFKCSRISKTLEQNHFPKTVLPCRASGWFPRISWSLLKIHSCNFILNWNTALLESFCLIIIIILLQFYFGLVMTEGNKANAVSSQICQNCGQSHTALCYIWSHELVNSSINHDSPIPVQLRLPDSPGSFSCQEHLLTPRHLLQQKPTTWIYSVCQAASHKFI